MLIAHILYKLRKTKSSPRRIFLSNRKFPFIIFNKSFPVSLAHRRVCAVIARTAANLADKVVFHSSRFNDMRISMTEKPTVMLDAQIMRYGLTRSFYAKVTQYHASPSFLTICPFSPYWCAGKVKSFSPQLSHRSFNSPVVSGILFPILVPHFRQTRLSSISISKPP